MGLHRPEVIAQKVDAIPGLCGEGRERRQRNYERVWLGIFIADKSFGIATGRPICVSWRELMPDVGDWWRGKWAAPYDRLLCGIAEMRLIVVSTSHHICSFWKLQLTIPGQSIRSSPDRIKVQGIYPPVAARKFQRCVSPPEQHLLLRGVRYAFQVASEPYPLILS